MTGMAPKYANGQLPLSALSSIGDGLYLEANAAAAWIQAKRAVFLELGIAPFISKPDGAYRDLAGQRRQKAAAIADGVPNRAATPGTSTHGTGVSLDINNIWQYSNARLDPIMARFGFKRNIPYESWHYTHDGSSAGTASGSVGSEIGTTPTKDEDDMPTIDEVRAVIREELARVRATPRPVVLIKRVADGHPTLNGMTCVMAPGRFRHLGAGDIEGVSRDLNIEINAGETGIGVPSIEFGRLLVVFGIPASVAVPGGDWTAA